MRRILALISVTALMAFTAVPAMAAPLFTGGLVNVTVVDAVDVNGNTLVVQLPIAVAANVCDVNVNVLAQQFRNGSAQCEATADAVAGA